MSEMDSYVMMSGIDGYSYGCDYCGAEKAMKVLKPVEGIDVSDPIDMCPRCMALLMTIHESPELVRKMLAIDLKEILMKLGNALVHRGYTPAGMVSDHEMDEPNTFLLAAVARWFNDNPQAREELEMLGLRWRM